MMTLSKPTVLCFSGHDASGGAGIQADIEAIASLGAHACTVVTALTVQNTQDVKSVYPIDAITLQQTVDCLLEDIKPAAIKIGLIASIEALNIIVATIKLHPNIPVILDPVLASGSGKSEMGKADLIQLIINTLLPLVTIITPNTPELIKISNDNQPIRLNQMGCDYVLITGTHADTEQVHNELYFNERLLDVMSVERLPSDYHGSGCTIASAISAMLAFGLDPLHACKEAVDFTFASLEAGFKIGQGQLIPNRLFWADNEE
jgi:hydroxymethylpyrimidine/phosphomethylpyrimidine kinase